MVLTDNKAIETLKHLVTICQESERRLYDAAEQTRNRGLKLVLKSYAQQRTRFADALISLLREAGYETARADTPGGALSRGWTEIQATMIVRREDRQQHVLTVAADEEERALQSYTQALQEPLPAEVQDLVRNQSVELQKMQRQLRLMAETEDHRILVRLFNQNQKAEEIVEELAEAGFDAERIYTAPVEAVSVYTNEQRARRRSQRQTVLTAAGVGALVGLVLGAFLAFAQRLYFPEVGGILTNTPAGLVVEVVGGGVLIGALFGALFGLFIGRDAVEDDAYLYEKSIQEGDTLVAVVADTATEAEAERIVGLRHEFEVEPVAS